MATFTDLFEDFIASRNDADPGSDDKDNQDRFRTSEHQLFEVIHGEPHRVAGWQNVASVDAMVWIANEWKGWERGKLEEQLREARLIVMTVLPTGHLDEPGADVIWWAHPAECMSCGTELEDDQRRLGLCPDCAELRRDIWEIHEEGESLGIEQRKGLHGSPLPRSRPSD